MKVYGWSLAGTVVALSAGLSATPSELVLHDGEVIRGEITATSILVPEGATVLFDAATRIVCTEGIVIAGVLQGKGPAPSEDLESADAPDLALVAEQVTVRGTLRGGDGAGFDSLAPEVGLGHAGGDGSSIDIRSDLVLIDLGGRIAAGDGGRGGAGAKGGDGGSVRVTGLAVVPDDWPIGEAAILGGRGAMGGPGFLPGQAGGDGGHSGGVSVVTPETRGSLGNPGNTCSDCDR